MVIKKGEHIPWWLICQQIGSAFGCASRQSVRRVSAVWAPVLSSVRTQQQLNMCESYECDSANSEFNRIKIEARVQTRLRDRQITASTSRLLFSLPLFATKLFRVSAGSQRRHTHTHTHNLHPVPHSFDLFGCMSGWCVAAFNLWAFLSHKRTWKPHKS